MGPTMNVTAWSEMLETSVNAGTQATNSSAYSGATEATEAPAALVEYFQATMRKS